MKNKIADFHIWLDVMLDYNLNWICYNCSWFFAANDYIQVIGSQV